jgi:DNA-binding SARP family transcriptional activator
LAARGGTAGMSEARHWLEFGILGPLLVTDDARVVDLGGHKQRAVLASLLVNANRVVSLDGLVDQLWGEKPPRRAVGSLQAYISNLRRALEPTRRPGTPPTVLVTQPPGYLLRVEPEAVDAARFEASAAAGHQLLAGQRPHAARRSLVEALAVWRGPALADFAFDAFAQAERHRLEELRLAATEDRLAAGLDLGCHAATVAELEALVGQHPLRERLWALRMLGLYRCGRQAEALAAFQQARRVLVDEIGIEPAPALIRLERDILHQAPSLDWTPIRDPEESAVILAAPTTASPPTGALISAPILVGREAELTRLEAALGRAISGQGQAVLIVGEPGIGKTRLVEELAVLAGVRDAEVVWGACYEGGEAPAFWPWVEILRGLVITADRDAIVRALGPGAAEAAQISPELEELLGTARSTPSVDPAAARFRLYQAVSALLVDQAERKPLVVVLDDLHWADTPSLQLAAFLAGRLRSAPILLVGTYRDPEVGPEHPLTDMLAALARHQASERLHLTGLGPAEITRFIAAGTGTAPSPELACWVHARTEGNPFFVAELVRLLQSEQVLAGTEVPPSVAAVVPSGARDIIRWRLSRLHERTHALLTVAAVVGREFDLAVVAVAAVIDVHRALELVEAALRSGVVEEHLQTVGRYRFSHELVRETIIGELTAMRRARLHASVAEALEGLHGDSDAHVAALAHHFFQAVPAGYADEASLCAVRAAEVASARLAYEEAEIQLRRALDLLTGLKPGLDRDSRELDVQTRLTLLLLMTKGYADPGIGPAGARALELSRAVGSDRQLLTSLVRLWAFHGVRAEFSAAAEYARDLLDSRPNAADVTFGVGGHWTAGTTALHRGQLRDARDHLKQAVILADSLPEPDEAWTEIYHHDPAVSSRVFLSLVTSLLGDQTGARQLMGQATALASHREHPFNVVMARFFDAWLSTVQQDAARVRHQAKEAILLAEEQGFRLYGAMAGVLHGWAIAHQSEADRGTTEIMDALSAHDATGARMLRHFFLAMLADAQWRANRPRQALLAVEAGLAEAQAVGEHFYQAELHRLRGELLMVVAPERRGEAADSLQRALTVARSQGAQLLESRAVDSRRRLQV